eukprot:1641138-Prymnesium_polylepis.1
MQSKDSGRIARYRTAGTSLQGGLKCGRTVEVCDVRRKPLCVRCWPRGPRIILRSAAITTVDSPQA